MSATAEAKETPWFVKAILERFPWIGKAEYDPKAKRLTFLLKGDQVTVRELIELQDDLLPIGYWFMNLYDEGKGPVLKFDFNA